MTSRRLHLVLAIVAASAIGFGANAAEDAAKPEPAKTEPAKVETPKAEASKPEAAKPEAPKTDTAKAEPPKTEPRPSAVAKGGSTAEAPVAKGRTKVAAAPPRKARRGYSRDELDRSIDNGTVPARYRSRIPREYHQYIPFDR